MAALRARTSSRWASRRHRASRAAPRCSWWSIARRCSTGSTGRLATCTTARAATLRRCCGRASGHPSTGRTSPASRAYSPSASSTPAPTPPRLPSAIGPTRCQSTPSASSPSSAASPTGGRSSSSRSTCSCSPARACSSSFRSGRPSSRRTASTTCPRSRCSSRRARALRCSSRASCRRCCPRRAHPSRGSRWSPRRPSTCTSAVLCARSALTIFSEEAPSPAQTRARAARRTSRLPSWPRRALPLETAPASGTATATCGSSRCMRASPRRGCPARSRAPRCARGTASEKAGSDGTGTSCGRRTGSARRFASSLSAGGWRSTLTRGGCGGTRSTSATPSRTPPCSRSGRRRTARLAGPTRRCGWTGVCARASP
mmetsp:Transcript_40849/g.132325  ORF Transcript_40849/g.132325 Transcript_40849/m.132325 type:complete len:373 (-) Transcript_40849:271-1389(-)